MFKLDYEQFLFPSLVRRASEKKSARKIYRRLAKTKSSQQGGEKFSRGADFLFFFRSRDGLSWEEVLLVVYVEASNRGQ